MEFSEVVRRRRMVRRYDPDQPVPRDVVERCLANAVRAPSAGFSQGWDFLVLTTEAERDLFWRTTTDPGAPSDSWLSGIRQAPALIVCLSDKEAYLDRYAAPDKGWTDRDEARWPVPYWDIDTGMAALLILLTAVDEGLGGLFFGVPPTHHGAVKEAFGIPAARRVVGVVSLGHPLPGPRSPSLRRPRRSAADVAHWGRFGVAGSDH
ncbi:nitroreductase family protein [Intrasporangium calvum]|uniref:Nitroreductase family protein n=1 Tax=Intrasporangium calvum TaxID=53358 RepID=A0ABT5GI74_9MICO|nr:nitroreductase family protein [Intrasporangium calvum]MDC5697832.1 nitroreductase family protein [Intrasporangium calvum]